MNWGDLLLSASLSFVVYAAIFVPLERVLAIHQYRWFRRGLRTDLLFLFANFLVWTPLVGLALVSLYAAVQLLPLAWLQDPVATMPYWLQAVIALLISDCAIYWFHRASHGLPLLWRFHRVHHSAESVDWVAAYREHPVDNLLTRCVENLPLFLLGLPLPMLAGFIAFRGLWALFIHSNVALCPGVLRYVLGSPRLHHWHHECEQGAHSNFANLNPLMDLIFGTYYDPGSYPERYGISGERRRSYWYWLLEPLGLVPRRNR